MVLLAGLLVSSSFFDLIFLFFSFHVHFPFFFLHRLDYIHTSLYKLYQQLHIYNARTFQSCNCRLCQISQDQLMTELITSREKIPGSHQNANPRVLDLEAANLLSILAIYSQLGSMIVWYAVIMLPYLVAIF